MDRVAVGLHRPKVALCAAGTGIWLLQGLEGASAGQFTTRYSTISRTARNSSEPFGWKEGPFLMIPSYSGPSWPLTHTFTPRLPGLTPATAQPCRSNTGSSKNRLGRGPRRVSCHRPPAAPPIAGCPSAATHQQPPDGRINPPLTRDLIHLRTVTPSKPQARRFRQIAPGPTQSAFATSVPFKGRCVFPGAGIVQRPLPPQPQAFSSLSRPCPAQSSSLSQNSRCVTTGKPLEVYLQTADRPPPRITRD